MLLLALIGVTWLTSLDMRAIRQSPMFKSHSICNNTSCDIFVQPLTSARGICNVIKKPPLTFDHGNDAAGVPAKKFACLK